MAAKVLQIDKDILRSQGAFNPLKLSGKLYVRTIYFTIQQLLFLPAPYIYVSYGSQNK
jgi:hypothetical protein